MSSGESHSLMRHSATYEYSGAPRLRGNISSRSEVWWLLLYSTTMSAAAPPPAASGNTTKPAQSSATSSRAILRSYYCICGDFILVLQGKLDRLPQRQLDGAWIIRSQSTPEHRDRKFKLSAKPGQRCLVRRYVSPPVPLLVLAAHESETRQD